MKLYSIFDMKAGSYGQIVSAVSNGVATRMFADLASDKENLVGRHPTDFRLIYVGNFNEETGVIEPVTHENLGSAADYVSIKQ